MPVTQDTEVYGRFANTVKWGAIVCGGLAGAITFIAVPFIRPAISRFPLPFAPASTQQVKNVLAALKGCSGSVVDIGSGDGRIVIAAAKAGFTSVGVELNFWLVLYSKYKAYREGCSSSAKFVKGDLWDFNLKPFSNIIIFGTEEMMFEFRRKLENEMLNEVVVLACRFPLEKYKPVEVYGSDIDVVWKYKLRRT